MAATASMAGPKNFHDSIRNMFTSAASANSTTSIAADFESIANNGKDLLDRTNQQNQLVLKMMGEQTKLLKKIAANSNGSGFSSGISTLDDILDIFSHGKKSKWGAKIGRVMTKLKSVFRLPLIAFEGIAAGAATAFGFVAAAGRNIIKPLEGLKNIFASSGVMKSLGLLGRIGGGITRLFGKLALPITALFGLIDGISGWNNAASILGKDAPNIGDKIMSAVGTAINGILFGIPDWLIQRFGGRNLASLMNSGKDFIISGTVVLGKGIGKFIGGAISSITDWIGDIKRYLPSVDDITKMAYSAFDIVRTALWDGLTYLGTAIKDSIVNFFTDLKKNIADWWNGTPGNAPPMTGPGASRSRNSAAPAEPGGAPTGGRGVYSVPSADDATPINYTTGTGNNQIGSTPETNYIRSPRPADNGQTAPQTNSSGRSADNSRTVGDGNTQFSGSFKDMSFGDTSTTLVNRLKQDFNLTDQQAVGAVANLAHESGGFKQMQEVGKAPGSGGYGLAQWTGSRRRNFENYAAQQGKSVDDPETQYQFLKQELNTTEKGSIDALRNTSTAAEATESFQNTFERPGVPNLPSRLAFADRVQAALTQAPKTTGSVTPTNQPSVTPDMSKIGHANIVQMGAGGLNWNGKMQSETDGLIFHHTGGRGTVQGVVNTLNQRGLGSQYIMDRDGTVYQTVPDGAQTSHIKTSTNGSGLSNKNAIGIEMIGKNNDDITDAQKEAGLKFIKDMQAKYPNIGNNIYGHGEVNPGHKEATEGMAVVGEYRDMLKKQPAQMPGTAQTAQSMATPTTVDMSRDAAVSASSPSFASQPSAAPIDLQTLQNKRDRAFDSPLGDTKIPPSAPPPVIPPNMQTGGVSADVNGKRPDATSLPGQMRVSDVPVVDEYKMLLGNGSAIT